MNTELFTKKSQTSEFLNNINRCISKKYQSISYYAQLTLPCINKHHAISTDMIKYTNNRTLISRNKLTPSDFSQTAFHYSAPILCFGLSKLH